MIILIADKYQVLGPPMIIILLNPLSLKLMRGYDLVIVAPRLILMITKQIEGVPIFFLFEKIFVLFRGKIVILPKP